MPFLIEHVTEVVFILFVIILLGNLFLIGIALARRKRRQKYFQRIDEFRDRYGPTIAGVLSGQLNYQQGFAELGALVCSGHALLLEQLCLDQKPAPAQAPVLRRLCEDLGFVKVWQQQLMGRIDPGSLREVLRNPQGLMERVSHLHFLIRAKSAENLGRIRHEPSWPLLVKALEDPHPDLQSVAARALGAIHHPGSFPALVERFHKVILGSAPSLSLRTIKSALIDFSLENASGLLGSLRHPNPRIRSMAADIIREMVEREAACDPDFSLNSRNVDGELAEVFLDQLAADQSPDVRARAAPVIACMDDPRSIPILLALLRDATWFVRLHAVRSLAKQKFLPHANQITAAVTDRNWRVREASVRTLRSFGLTGIERLTEHFLATDDQYSREQIADEFQRAGLIPEFVMRWDSASDGEESRVMEHLVEMGKTGYLISVVVQTNGDGHIQRKFLQRFGCSPDPQIQRWVEQSARQEGDPELRSMAQAALITSERRHKD